MYSARKIVSALSLFLLKKEFTKLVQCTCLFSAQWQGLLLVNNVSLSSLSHAGKSIPDGTMPSGAVRFLSGRREKTVPDEQRLKSGLGLQVKLTLKNHIQKVIQKARRIIVMVSKCIYHCQTASAVSCHNVTYITLYGARVWFIATKTHLRKIEVVQCKLWGILDKAS